MKKRMGYISNSSSSSFICCYATIKDLEKAKQYIESKNINKWSKPEIKTKTEIINNYYSCDGADWAGVYCEPNYSDEYEHYLIFESCGGAGDCDSDFCVTDDCYDMDYDVDYDDFEEWEREFIEGVTEENGFIDVQIGYGAGRNG